MDKDKEYWEQVLGIPFSDIQDLKYVCDAYNISISEIIDIIKEVMYEESPF